MVKQWSCGVGACPRNIVVLIMCLIKVTDCFLIISRKNFQQREQSGGTHYVPKCKYYHAYHSLNCLSIHTWTPKIRVSFQSAQLDSPRVLFEMIICSKDFVLSLITVYFSFIQQHHLKSYNITVSKVFCLGCSAAEGKLSVLFCYYSLVVLLYFIATMILVTASDEFISNLVEYLICSAGGYRNECKEHKERAVQSLATGFVLLTGTTILFSFINLAHFMYIVRFHAVKKVMQKHFKHCARIPQQYTHTFL